MKLIRNIAIGGLSLIAILAVIGLSLPSQVRVERAQTINVQPETLYTILSSLKATQQWSPWLPIDPNTQIELDGAPRGEGAVLRWQSENPSVGVGQQEIIAANPSEFVRIRVTMDGFGESIAEFTLSEASGGTQVVWRFEKELSANPLERYMGTMMESWVGPDYERGLGNLKAFAEALPSEDWMGREIELVELEPRPILAQRIVFSDTVEALNYKLGVAYLAMAGAIDNAGERIAGPPVSIAVGVENDKLLVDAGLPVAPDFPSADLPGMMRLTNTPGGRALKAIHTGRYDTLNETYVALLGFALATGETPKGSSWSAYVGDPATTPAESLRTLIYLPIE